MNAPETTSNFLSVPIFAIGGLDPSGGAGIAADLKTICAHGCYGAAAVTAITEQNSLGVGAVDIVGPESLMAQMRAVLSDLKPGAIKIGMMGNGATVAAICDMIEGRDITLVLDPVFVSSSGRVLLDDDGISLLKTRLLPMTSLLTPNLAEAAHLADMPIHNTDDMQRAGEKIRALGAKAVLVTGGHLDGPQVIDVLVAEHGTRQFSGDKISSLHTHGTGCTLASAIACNLAQGRSLEDSVANARDFVRRAILTAPGLGAGHGPLNHILPVNRGGRIMARPRKGDYFIRAASGPDDMGHVRRLIEAYLAELQIDLCFQGVDAELAGLPGDYAAPTGACFLAFAPADRAGEDPIGMVALRRMEDGICEMKRLYVAKAHRTGGLGYILCRAILDQARDLGYHTMKLDTLKRLTAAVHLYQRLGFEPTQRYNDNPYDDILYLQITL